MRSNSPYRMRFAIYVRKGEETFDKVDEVPEQLRIRTLAVRAFDADAMMAGWELVDGRDLDRGDRTAVRQSERGLSAHPLRGAGLLRGAGGAQLVIRLSEAARSARSSKPAGSTAAVARPDDGAHAARRSLCLPSKFGATSRMKRSISSFTWLCGFMPTLK